MNVKHLRILVIAVVSLVCLLTSEAFAAENKPKDKKLKPYPLKTCAVTDENLGSMGNAYVFEHQGREIKLCCKACLKEFKKDPAKYVKKIEQAEKKNKK